MRASPKSLTIRLPHDLYETARAVARRREMSLNALVRNALEVMAKDEEKARLYEAFGLLGADIKESEVEFALPAQREVVTREITRSKSRRKSRTR
jgi:hypothetical protein